MGLNNKLDLPYCVASSVVLCQKPHIRHLNQVTGNLGAVSIRKTVLLGMAIPMLKIRRPTGRLIFNMGIPIPGKTVFYIETGPCASHLPIQPNQHYCPYYNLTVV